MPRRTVPAAAYGGGGAGVGTALATIIVHLVPSLVEVEVAISVVLSALLAFGAIWLAPRPPGEPGKNNRQAMANAAEP